MSTSFPNNNGNGPPYNSQTNGSFNQYAQGAPPGAFPGMEQYHHMSMYGQSANGYAGMPGMGGPPQSQPAGGPPQPQKPLPPIQYPGAGAGGHKLPGYDGNPMQNGYMPYPQQRPGPPSQNGQAPMGQANGPPPSYNGHPHMPPASSHYNGVSDPYRMYSGMPGQPGQAPPAQQRPMPPVSSAAQPSQPRPPPQQASQHYPSQQSLPAHLHPGASQYPQMTNPNAPLQHYQPANFVNSTPPVRGASNGQPALKTSKETETRPNNLPPQFANPYQGNFGAPGPLGSGTPTGPYGAYGGPGAYPGYGMPGGPGRPDMAGTPGSNPGANGASVNGQTTPGGQGPHGFGNQNGFSTSYPSSSMANVPGNSGQFGHPGPHPPFGSAPTSTSNGAATSFGNPGMVPSDPAASGPSFGTSGHQNPNALSRQATPNTPTTPGTPGSHGPHGNAPPTQSPLAHQQAPLRTPPPTLQPQQPMPNQMPPPQYNANNLMSPNNSAPGSGASTPAKQPARSPMGSNLPPLNGQFAMGPGQGPAPGLSNLQSPSNPPSTEPTFKEPAIPIRHSPAHMQSPVHPPAQPPAYNSQPSTSTQKPPEANPTKPPSPTFAVPTLPAAVTLAQASASQVSTKQKTSPTKKKGDDAHEPPTPDTPFTVITHFEMPAAMVVLRDSLVTKTNSPLEKYFSRKRQQLRHPYPEGANAHNVPAQEPDTFGFLQGTKYFDAKYNRGITIPQPMGPPVLSRSQSMHAPMMSPSFNAQQASTSGRQPAKKARSASEEQFTMPLPPSRQQMRPADPRALMHYQQQQQMQYQQMQKMQQQQQMMARQHQMGGPGTIPSAQGPSQLPPLAPPSLQRADSMPQLPTQQPMGSMPPHMGLMPPMNGTGHPGEGQTLHNTATGPNNNNGTRGLPPLSLGSSQGQGTAGTQSLSHDFGPRTGHGQQPSTSSSQAQVHCAGCHHFILPGSSTLCCMYHDCKNVFHRECTRLSPSAYTRFEQENRHARWVCPTCEPMMRQLHMQHVQALP